MNEIKRKCPYCGKEIEASQVVKRDIFYIGRNAFGRKASLTKKMTFCSNQCAGNYQMGCEG